MRGKVISILFPFEVFSSPCPCDGEPCVKFAIVSSGTALVVGHSLPFIKNPEDKMIVYDFQKIKIRKIM